VPRVVDDGRGALAHGSQRWSRALGSGVGRDYVDSRLWGQEGRSERGGSAAHVDLGVGTQGRERQRRAHGDL
jgi:hypothetical protein